MRPDPSRLARMASRARAIWHALTAWGPDEKGRRRVDLGRRPIRPAIAPLDWFRAEEPSASIEEARRSLARVIDAWPEEEPRVAVEGDTGLGKTWLAVRRCVRHVVSGHAGRILFVTHTRERVYTVLGEMRREVREAGGREGEILELLGRQAIHPHEEAGWDARRFGCRNTEEHRRFGRRGRRVRVEVCRVCPLQSDCKASGYLAHTAQAAKATVIVTTIQRLTSVPERLWKRIDAVICDEDVMPGLLQEFWVLRSDIERALSYIEKRSHRVDERHRALRALRPLLRATLDAINQHDSGEAVALALCLPEACQRYMTAEGVSEVLAALPLRKTRRGLSSDVLAPAEWERAWPGYTPRQVWGPLMMALASDLGTGDSARAATIRVTQTRLRKSPARLHVVRYDERTIRHLRSRPLLVLDATLHPALAPILDVRHERIAYRPGRQIVQVLSPLLGLSSLHEAGPGGRRLTPRGQRIVAHLAAWFGGRHGYVLCRKSIRTLLETEAKRYYELSRARFVTIGSERGWDADPRASVLVILGRYAKNAGACVREAHALRSIYRRLTGTTALLDALEIPNRPQPFVGRGLVLLYCGEPVERSTRTCSDRLAAKLQDADRIATVRQFIGRDRNGQVYVLLLRGDPTIPVDALVEDRDLAAALPAGRG